MLGGVARAGEVVGLPRLKATALEERGPYLRERSAIAWDGGEEYERCGRTRVFWGLTWLKSGVELEQRTNVHKLKYAYGG